MSRHIMVLNGPNLDRLGTREPEIYGDTSYTELMAEVKRSGTEMGFDVEIRQTAGEGELVSMIHEAGEHSTALVLNAAAYTHTSVAIRDAVLTLSIPVVEVHLSNPAGREDFRRRNLLTDVVTASVQGFGGTVYLLALEGLRALLEN